MGACVPEFRESIRILVDDHFRLLAQIRTVMSKAEQGGESMRDAVLADVNDLIGFIRNHEAREHEMAGAARRRAAGR
jgi:hemerythrin-like domain-containing protein